MLNIDTFNIKSVSGNHYWFVSTNENTYYNHIIIWLQVVCTKEHLYCLKKNTSYVYCLHYN